MEDDFDAIYGASEKKGAAPSTKTAQALDINLDEQDDDALFQQLYGDSFPKEEPEQTERSDAQTDVVLHRTCMEHNYHYNFNSCDLCPVIHRSTATAGRFGESSERGRRSSGGGGSTWRYRKR